jgi:hypothetical protein
MQDAYEERGRLLTTAEEIGLSISEYVLEQLGAQLPSIEDQKRFKVSISELRRRDDANYYSPERLQAISLVHQLPYKSKPLGEVVTFNVRRLVPKEHPDQRFHYLSLANVQSHTGELLGDTLVTGQDVLSQSNCFERGDILFGRLRPYLNKVYCADSEVTEGLCSTEFYVVHPTKDFDKLFLTYYLLSPLVVKQTKHSTTGSALPRLLKQDFCEIEAPLVQLNMQKQIASEIESRRVIVRQQLKAAEDCITGAKREVENLILGESFENDEHLQSETSLPFAHKARPR